MIKLIRSRKLLFIGFILVVLGFLIPFLIVTRVLPSTFFLNFFSYGASIVGLFLGLIGVSREIAGRRNTRY